MLEIIDAAENWFKGCFAQAVSAEACLAMSKERR